MAPSHSSESPMQELPDELLRDIFAFCIPELPSIDISKAPLLLCQVCAHWRAVAADSATLWTTFRLELFNRVEDRVEKRLRDPLLPIMWLGRCKDAGINFQMVFSHAWEKQPPHEDQIIFFERLTSSIPAFRFHSLTFNQVGIDPLISLPKGAFPFLHRLVLNTSDSDFEAWREASNGETILAFEDCPLLNRVALGSFKSEYLLQIIRLPWHQLTHFLFHEEADTHVLDLCATHMENLQFAHFGVGSRTSSSPPGPVKHAAFDNLKGLSLSYWFSNLSRMNTLDRFWSFDVPNLKYLGIHTYWCGWDAVQPESPFLTKLASFEMLERLAITSSQLPLPTVRLVLGCLPRLQTLELDIWQGLINISKALTLVSARASDNLVPTLKTLVLDIGHLEQTTFDHYSVSRDGSDQQAEALQAMVASRRSPSTPHSGLEKIVLYTEVHELTEHIVQTLLQCLDPFVKEGLKLEHRLQACESKKDGIGEYWYERAQPDVSDWPDVGELFTLVDY
ncbi:hypothetical protein BKA70DRAFT_1556256 [Coprinopsis sp. MPI-PUGE-AT-0042]|nr:hypothetical protein BKA70DRAFT_1556256 [Coprinopsis sp. MPI-PUGE-AT-0042]